MFIFWFIVIIVALIVVHEFGHFILAKLLGIRVDEFGIGFPPKLFGFKYGETEYTINLIPFGGFVKIFGEDPDEESIGGPDSDRSFVNKPKWAQAVVLVAGVAFNTIFAWMLFVLVFMVGMPTSTQGFEQDVVQNAELTIIDVLEESPADQAGLEAGDVITHVESVGVVAEELTSDSVTAFIQEHGELPISVTYKRGGDTQTVEVMPVFNTEAQAPVVGVYMDTIGTVQLGLVGALGAGTLMTGDMIAAISVGLYDFFKQIALGTADFGSVAGPVGIVGLVGDASALGIVYVLNFIAIISLHLAILNLVPFPALDGGRLLFVLIEKIKGSPISPRIANMVNGVGFLLLLLLMLVITYNDILRLL